MHQGAPLFESAHGGIRLPDIVSNYPGVNMSKMTPILESLSPVKDNSTLQGSACF